MPMDGFAEDGTRAPHSSYSSLIMIRQLPEGNSTDGEEGDGDIHSVGIYITETNRQLRLTAEEMRRLSIDIKKLEKARGRTLYILFGVIISLLIVLLIILATGQQ